MAVPTGFEPAIFCVTGRRDRPLHYGTINNWLREMDLNQRPLGYEPSELPSCSIPRYYKWRRKRDSNPCAALTTSRFSRPVPSTRLGYSSVWCLRPDLNRHECWSSQDFKSCASTNSATQAQIMVSRWRFELQTLWLKVRCSTGWANGTNIKLMAASARFELAHVRVKVWCLTTWLQGNILSGGKKWIRTTEP